jgi:hypothetical protein
MSSVEVAKCYGKSSIHTTVLNCTYSEHYRFFLNSGLLGTIHPQIPSDYCTESFFWPHSKYLAWWVANYISTDFSLIWTSSANKAVCQKFCLQSDIPSLKQNVNSIIVTSFMLYPNAIFLKISVTEWLHQCPKIFTLPCYPCTALVTGMVANMI